MSMLSMVLNGIVALEVNVGRDERALCLEGLRLLPLYKLGYALGSFLIALIIL